MNRYVILSTNDNPDYLNYLPYIQKAWNNLGWKTVTLCVGTQNIKADDKNTVFCVENDFEGIRAETLVQAGRLFMYKCLSEKGNPAIMIGDVDMIPCSSYWNPCNDETTVTSYGHDLTNYRHYPMCYIAMSYNIWAKIFPDNFDTALSNYPQVMSDRWEEWWQVDQDMLMNRLNFFEKVGMIKINRINRGTSVVNGATLAYGRIDRYDWEGTKNIDNAIDAHMPRPFSKEAAEFIMKKFHPNVELP